MADTETVEFILDKAKKMLKLDQQKTPSADKRAAIMHIDAAIAALVGEEENRKRKV